MANTMQKQNQSQKNLWGYKVSSHKGLPKFHSDISDEASSRCDCGCGHEVGLDLASGGWPFLFELIHLPCDQEADGVVLPNALVDVFATPAVQHQGPGIEHNKLENKKGLNLSAY